MEMFLGKHQRVNENKEKLKRKKSVGEERIGSLCYKKAFSLLNQLTKIIIDTYKRRSWSA